MANRFLSNIRINDAYTFPASDGTNNQVIKTDGSGNLSFGQLAADSASVMYKDTFTGDGSTTGFSLANALNDEVQSNIYIDGVYQSKSTYSVSGTTVTFSTAPASGHEIEVISTTGINSGPTAIYTDTFTANGSATAFTLGQTVHDENQTMVFLNGVYQFKGTYALSGTTLTLDTAPANGVAIEVMSIGSAYSGGDILYDHDFTSAGLMTTNGSGVYSITANNSANWNTAYGWGDHSTQSYATQSYVGTQISNLVDSSPATLNTLNELAAALGDDPNFATTTANSIGTKMPLAGGTFTGNVSLIASSAVNLRVTDGTQNVYVGSSGNTRFGLGAGASIIQSTGASFGVGTQDGNSLILGTNNTAALTINTSQNATFAGDVIIDHSTNTDSTLKLHSYSSAIGDAYAWNLTAENSGNSYAFRILQGTSPVFTIANTASGATLGAATFAGSVIANTGSKITSSSTDTTFSIETTSGSTIFPILDFVSSHSSAGARIRVSGTDVISLDKSQNATFAGNISGVRGFFNSGTTNVVATFTSTDGIAAIGLIDSSGSVELSASGDNFRVQPAGGVAQLTVGAGSSVFAEQLGIGTSPGSNMLYVKGTTNGADITTRFAPFSNNASSTFFLSSVSSGDGGYFYNSNNNSSGLFSYGDYTFYVGTGNLSGNGPANPRMIIKQGGDVGIGTTTPGSLLTVRKDAAGGRGGEISIVNYASNTVGNEAALNFGLEGSTYHGDFGNAQIKARVNASNAASDMIFSTWNGSSFGERMRIGSSGNLSLATATSLNFNVGDAAFITAKESMVLVIDSDNNQTGRVFQIKSNGVNGDVLFSLGDNGQLGLGTTSPDAKLEVKEGHTILGGTQNNYGGNVFTTKLGGYGVLSSGTNRYGSYGWLAFNSNNNYTGGARPFAFTNGYKANEFALLMGTADQAQPTLGSTGSVANGQLVFHVNNSADFMFGKVAGDGNGPHLQVNSYGYSTTFQGSSTANIVTYKTGTELNTNVGALVFRDNGNDYCGQITVNGSTNTTSYLSASDYRLKEDLKDFNGIDLVDKIPVYNFKWKKENVRTFGVLAHELKEVLPLVVDGDKDEEKYQTVDYSKIVPVLIKAIQELKADNDSLKARIETLENN